MSGLFSPADMELIESVARKSKADLAPAKSSGKSISADHAEIERSMQAVLDYFKDSPAILITSQEELHNYVLRAIEFGSFGIDTETTGLDRIKDTIVGVSLYFPDGVECYIPSKHIIHMMEQPYPNQLTYEQIGSELQLLVDAKTKAIFANADFDIAMIYKDLGVDFIDTCYFDVLTAWRCLKENEPSKALKVLYVKYVLKGQGDPKKFSDFFSPRLFPYCKPEVAKLYAANDAKITYDLFLWQLPYVTKTHPKCQKNHLEKIADLVWNIEIPMIKVCAMLHRVGVYLDTDSSKVLHDRYQAKHGAEVAKLSELVQELINQTDLPTNTRRPFLTGADFNPNSPPHVKYLLNKMLGVEASETDKGVLKGIGHPVTNQILEVRGAVKLMSTYVDKLPSVVAPDGRIHATFKSIGADTGRMSSTDPNMQNIPSHAMDIRHMFRATAQRDYCIEQIVEDSCTEVESVVDNGHQVYTPNGLIFVTQLKPGNRIILEENGKEIICNVKDIKIEGASTRICYDVI